MGANPKPDTNPDPNPDANCRVLNKSVYLSLLSWRKVADDEVDSSGRMWKALMTMVGYTMVQTIRFWRDLGYRRRLRAQRCRYLPIHVRLQIRRAKLDRAWRQWLYGPNPNPNASPNPNPNPNWRQWLYGLAVSEIQEDSRELARQGKQPHHDTLKS